MAVGVAGFSTRLFPIGSRPSNVRRSSNGMPVDQACGLQAVGYSTGYLVSSRSYSREDQLSASVAGRAQPFLPVYVPGPAGRVGSAPARRRTRSRTVMSPAARYHERAATSRTPRPIVYDAKAPDSALSSESARPNRWSLAEIHWIRARLPASRAGACPHSPVRDWSSYSRLATDPGAGTPPMPPLPRSSA